MMKRAGFGNVSKIVGINNLDKTVCGGVFLCLYCGKWCFWGVCVSCCLFVSVGCGGYVCGIGSVEVKNSP